MDAPDAPDPVVEEDQQVLEAPDGLRAVVPIAKDPATRPAEQTGSTELG